jgi:8-oxo-dGTP pyrophosphatase MutT (NUDIX family)
MSDPAETSATDQQAMRPRDAATLIVVDRSKGEPHFLMGQRHMRHVFMPGKYVFPGGRVDKSDRIAPAADEPRRSELDKLLFDMKGQPSQARARAIVLAAIRETFEEAGLIIGAPASASVEPAPEGWEGILAEGYLPAPSRLTFFARAITPPGRPRRFDSRFFYCDISAVAGKIDPPSDELQRLDWFSAEQIRSLDLPAITRVVIEDLLDMLRQGEFDPNAPIPYYTNRNGTFRREIITP